MSSDKTMIQFDRVSKRYKRNLRSSSIREAVPAVVARMLGRSSGKDARRKSGAFWAVNDVSFEVRRGEALGIIGHNGAGKSTILKLLAGVTAPTSGHIHINGRFAAIIELGAGFQGDLTGRENVYLNGSILGLRRVEIDRKFDSIVDFAGLEKFIDTPVKRYSSGMQARLGFAVVAHVEPEVLLVDEVLSVGDAAFQRKCMNKMGEFRANGAAIVFVSHNLNGIAELCTKALLLQSGEVVATGEPGEVIDTYVAAARALAVTTESKSVEIDGAATGKRMEIVGVEIRDEDGQLAHAFSPGAQAIVHVYVRAHEDLHDPHVFISVINESKIFVYETSTTLHGAPIGDVVVGQDIAVSFSLTLNLCPSSYSIDAGVMLPGGRIGLDWRENIEQFEIAGEGAGTGIADLRSSVTVSHGTAQDIQDGMVNQTISA